jgi:hypothetical protein
MAQTKDSMICDQCSFEADYQSERMKIEPVTFVWGAGAHVQCIESRSGCDCRHYPVGTCIPVKGEHESTSA